MSVRRTMPYAYPYPCALLALCATLTAAFSASTAFGAGLQRVDVLDAQGFSQPVTAFTAEIPAGWQTRGGVNWNRGTNCVGNQVLVEWVAQSRDGKQAFEIMHGYTWQVQGTQIPTNPCPVMPFATTRAFLQAVVDQRRPGARILQYRERPDIAEAAARASRPQPQVRSRQDAGEVLIAYTHNGVDTREVIGTTVAFTDIQGFVMGGAKVVFALRAPNGQLDFGFGERLIGAIKTNSQWVADMTQSTRDAEQRFSSKQRAEIDRWHAGEMARINAKGAADRAAIRADANREVARIQSETYANTQATNDRMHRRTLESIGEYNTYRSPDGNPVRSSIHSGSRVLRNADGSYTSTDDPSYNPPGSQELKRIK